jgi:hypothetical protein
VAQLEAVVRSSVAKLNQRLTAAGIHEVR